MNPEVENHEDEIPEDDETLEAEAREMGWKPLDEFAGNPDDWRDAAEFVERGKSILPIVQANNRRLRDQLLTQSKELASLKETVGSVNKTLQALRKGYDESVSQQVAQAKKDLRAQLAEARDIGDLDAELEAQDKLTELKETEKASKEKAKEDEKPTTEQPNIHPEFEAWKEDNPWFDDTSNPENVKRTRQLLIIGEQLRLDGDETVGRAFMDKCVAELNKREGKPTVRKSGTKVESGSHGANPGGSRLFNSLPKEAKAICHEDTDKFVGPGKMFKTKAEWEDHFAELYDNSGE